MSGLEFAGPMANRIASLTTALTAVAVAVWLVVLGAFILAGRRGSRGQALGLDAVASGDAAAVRWIVAATSGTVLVLLGALAMSLSTGATLARVTTPAVQISVTGHQWWWELRFEDSLPSRRFTSANEVRVPAGLPVELRMTSRDVIHSLWVPTLAGKQDLIPGYSTVLRIEADTPGVYRGTCAEFCGLQHARMQLEVVAMPARDYAAWWDAQLAPARPPSDSLATAGQTVFLRGPCVLCHTVRGTSAGGRLGPDLTHLASRRTIAAGILPNTPTALAAWVRDPTAFKPGSRMPPTPLGESDLRALVAYLQTLR